MFARLGRTAHTRRRWFLLAAVLLTALAGAFGPAVSEAVRTGGFTDPAAESSRATELLDETFGRTDADVVVLWTHDQLTHDDPAFAAALTGLLGSLPTDAVERTLHPWIPGLPPESAAAMLGEDGHSALAVLSLAGGTDDDRRVTWERIEGSLEAPAGWRTEIAGGVPVNLEMQHLAETDIVRAEMLAMPVLFLLMAILFGSLVSALLPVTIGVLAILGAMGLLRALTLVTDVQTFALNVTTILGLGLAIDYALFMVSRFREELARSEHDGVPDVGRAVERTVATAGRTVAFSGLTVLIAFAGLLFFPHMFLRSMGLGGMAVVLLDMVLALTLLPALLSLLGRRVDAGRLPVGLLARLSRRRPATSEPAGAAGSTRADDGGRGWDRVARTVLRRPGLVALAATAVLAVVALPALDLQTGQTDSRDLPATADTRIALAAIETAFPDSQDVTLDVVVDGLEDPAALTAWAADLAALPGATGAHLAGLDGDRGHLVVRTDGAVDAPATRDLVTSVRALAPPTGATSVVVGGGAAVALDSVDAITRTLPATLGFVAGVTLLLLFMALGSVVLPIKAVLMNVVSLAATLGMVAWGFSQGHLSGLLGFEETGRVDPANLVLIGLIAFGLAMDYELFLLSRVREEHLRGTDVAGSITAGLRRSGRTITSAALLLVVVLVAMGTSDITFLKLIGLGLAFAVIVDATLVRALLVPATMALLGRAAWWLPGPLARLHRVIGVSEGDDEPRTGDPVRADVPVPALVTAGR